MSDKLILINTDSLEVKGSGEWEKLAIAAVESCPKIKKSREKEIIFDRFGIGKKPKTLEQQH
jgi:hypothetical protein